MTDGFKVSVILHQVPYLFSFISDSFQSVFSCLELFAYLKTDLIVCLSFWTFKVCIPDKVKIRFLSFADRLLLFSAKIMDV